MTELGHNLAGPPPRAGQPASHPPNGAWADTRPAPHSAPPGLRRADPLRPTKTAKRPDPPDPAARLHIPMRTSPSPPPKGSSRGERACPGRDPGGGVRWGLAANKTPHPEEAATVAVSKGLPRRRPGDAPAPLPHSLACPPAKARGLDPRGGTHGPNPAATAPASCLRAGDAHRTGATTHPEN
jgi:hypothetical protein